MYRLISINFECVTIVLGFFRLLTALLDVYLIIRDCILCNIHVLVEIKVWLCFRKKFFIIRGRSELHEPMSKLRWPFRPTI